VANGLGEGWAAFALLLALLALGLDTGTVDAAFCFVTEPTGRACSTPIPGVIDASADGFFELLPHAEPNATTTSKRAKTDARVPGPPLRPAPTFTIVSWARLTRLGARDSLDLDRRLRGKALHLRAIYGRGAEELLGFQKKLARWLGDLWYETSESIDRAKSERRVQTWIAVTG
jgi:hypothetical protein